MALTNTIMKGDDLMLFYQGKSIAFATAHTVSISADAVDVSSKDHGIWKASSVNKISWEITCENLYTAAGYDMLFNLMMQRQAVNVWFGGKQDLGDGVTVADNPTNPEWTPATGFDGYAGNVVITSLSMNANSGENATYSVTLTGVGQLQHTTYKTQE